MKGRGLRWVQKDPAQSLALTSEGQNLQTKRSARVFSSSVLGFSRLPNITTSAKDVSSLSGRDFIAASFDCGRGERVQGVLTLFCSGAAQVCHDPRVEDLREQLEVEEEDGDRQEEEVEEKGEVESRRTHHGDDRG